MRIQFFGLLSTLKKICTLTKNSSRSFSSDTRQEIKIGVKDVYLHSSLFRRLSPDECRTKSLEMSFLLAIFKFCTTNHLFIYTFLRINVNTLKISKKVIFTQSRDLLCLQYKIFAMKVFQL